MTELAALFADFSTLDAAVAALIVAVVLLFGVSVAFSAYAIGARMDHVRRDELADSLTERWQAPVLQALLEPGRTAEVHEMVEERYQRHFVQFILDYSRRVRGEERDTLRRIALPYLPLIASRVHHRNPEVRTRAIQTLGSLGLPKYADTLIEALGDSSALVSMVAARYMARQDYPELAAPILEHLERFEGWNRRFLASMLAAMGSDVAPLLREVLADSERSPWIRAVMADALLMMLDPQAGDVAAQVLVEEDDRELLSAVLSLLAVIGRPGHAAVIRARCTSRDEVIRARALRALGVVSGREAIPILVRGMDDDEPWVALNAARGLREAGGTELLQLAAAGQGQKAALAGQVLAEEPGQ